MKLIKDKILLFCEYPIEDNAGGPVGYYNKCIVDNVPENLILLQSLKKNINKLNLFEKIKLHTNNLFINRERKNFSHPNAANTFIKVQAKKYKFLYFHDIYTLYNVLHLIDENQVVILQSHTPELPSIEELNSGVSKAKYEKIVSIEKQSFNRANYIILPNKNCIPIYETIIIKNNKLKFLTTGIKTIQSNTTIPLNNDKINLLYIGRRNEVKGFDFLINSFVEVLKHRNDLRLFVAGNGNKINHKDIIDLGRTEIPFDWINAVDFVISLNKTSYFDLNIIETIALGTPLIMTTTEGHEFFKNRNGIIDVTYDNFIKIMVDDTLLNKQYKKDNIENLKQLFENQLSSKVYNKKLAELCSSIISENP